MDSGMAAHAQVARDGGFDQAAGSTLGGTAGDAASVRLRVRASGFGQGMPTQLIEALRTCGALGVRIEMGPWAPDIAGPSPADLHLVAVGGADADVNAPEALADGMGRYLAVCIDADEGMALRAIAAGADGVLCLRDGSDDLARALRAAASGMPAFTATAARALVAHVRATMDRQAPVDDAPGRAASRFAIRQAMLSANPPANPLPATAIRLTAREREVIMLANQGCTFTQAARLMGVQVSTVYTHVRRLYEKLSVNSLPQALHEARRMGLL